MPGTGGRHRGLVGKRSLELPIRNRGNFAAFDGLAREHRRKPDEFYRMNDWRLMQGR